eukprot:CAMPEP_0172499192 /NCGR_PEP_ID=MMETSP1066-20121228/123691_1 /TAXON_ID=671091 /ORGANISM="Coscinodiscus wailesii, Strain CCMP2513" /LENGTH=264 /DNA_ID=CAMNT_0013272803 /DNA_START=175 /DNA_END=969 /DNA_ORIENTATION=+
MGALHDGHLSLARQARKNNDVVVASVFVNPTQFGEKEDLEKYPRQLERDTSLLDDIGVDHVFAPDNDIMYGKNHVTYVEAMGFDNIPEGTSRKGHFRGVATIVTKLLNIVQPTTAYFGQKDAAQCVLIRRIVEDLNIPVNIEVLDTIRETDGLAMSSRNLRLTEEERRAVPVIYKSLRAANDQFSKVMLLSSDTTDPVISSTELISMVYEILRSEPLIAEVHYVSVDDKETMQPITKVNHNGAILSLACQVGSVRLIDNIVLSV